MKSEYTVEWLLKATTEELKNFFTNSSIADIIGVIESVNSLEDMDYMSKMQIDTIDNHISDEKLRLDACDRRIDFATKTNAPAGEISELWTEYENIDNRLDTFNSQKEKIKQNFADKKNAIVNLARNAIATAPASLIEAHRIEVLNFIQDKINRIERGKNNKEITVDTLTSEPEGFTKEDIEARSIGEEIARLESEVNSGHLPLTDTLAAKIKSMRKKKESLEETTFTHICTEKIKVSLKGLSNDITELQLELYSILNLSTEEYRTKLVNRFNEEQEHIRVCNAIRIYRSYVENLINVPIGMKKDYRSICAKYNSILEYLQDPKLNNVSLSSINEEINTLMKKYARLETYKKALIDTSKEEKYLYPTVKSSGLFNLPFNEEVWHTYFGKLYEEVGSLDKLKDINSKYESLINTPTYSSDIKERITDYKITLEDLLNNLYNQILSLYFKKNCLINVNVYDYRSREGFNKYVEYRKNTIDMEISTLKGKISILNKDKTTLLSEVESNFNKIEDLKRNLNALLKGEMIKKEEPKVEESHQKIEKPSVTNTIPSSLEALVNLDNYANINLEDDSLVEEDTSVNLDNKVNEVSSLKEKPPIESKFNPNDIFESSSVASISTPKKDTSTIFDDSKISFNPDNNIVNFDNEISSIDQDIFRDLLEPKVEEGSKKDDKVLEESIIDTIKEEESPIKRGIKVIKIEEVKKQETKRSDAEEIAERIKEGISKSKPMISPVSSQEVLPEYNDLTAPINLDELTKPVENNTEPIDLMSLLAQIENNDDTRGRAA